jgi:hypothetical protein
VKPGYWLIPLVLIFASAWLVGCSPTVPTGASSPAASTGPNPVEKAAAQATAMIQSAEATAMVLQAQAKATTLVQSAGVAQATPLPTPMPLATLLPSVSQATSTALPSLAPVAELTTPEEADTDAVQLVRVEVGNESGLILVQFKAPPALARKWQQGSVYVVDEATSALYNEIPVLPIVGPLFARPKAAGQIGHVMFTNATPGASGLHRGSVVTVVLGAFKQEHVTVQ